MQTGRAHTLAIPTRIPLIAMGSLECEVPASQKIGLPKLGWEQTAIKKNVAGPSQLVNWRV
jgi:hypothetical protein